MLERGLAKHRSRAFLWLGAIVAFACILASVWVVRVPFYQEPDELAHVDYVFQLFDVGHAFRVDYKQPNVEVAPQTRYLTDAVGYRKMRYNPYARVPPGYGTPAYFRALDSGVPRPSGRAPRFGAAIPYVMYLYPPGYYVVEAVLLSASYHLYGSLSDGFFAIREANVVLLAGTLLLSYFSFRAYGCGQRMSLLAVFAIGTFPLTSIVSSYVQPDNATTFLIAATIYGVARGRHDLSWRSDAIAIGSVSLLFLVKPHYAVAAWLVTIPALALRMPQRRAHLLVRIALATLPLAAFALSNRYLNPVSGMESPFAFVSRTRSTLPSAGFTFGDTIRLTADALTQGLNGTIFRGFWFSFGFRSGHIYFKDVAGPILGAFTICGFVTLGLADFLILKRLTRVARRFHPMTALRLLSAGHPLNLYIVTSIVLISAHVLTGGVLELEGRYWFPLLLPLAIVALHTVPRPLAHKLRRSVVLKLSVALAAYAIFAGSVGLRAMNADFYEPLSTQQREPVAEILAMRSEDASSSDPYSLILRRPQTVHVSGYAIDMLTGLAARNLYVDLDGHTRIGASQVRLPYAAVARTFNDDRVGATRFTIELPARALGVGRHELRFFVGDLTRSNGIPFRRNAWIVVGATDRSISSASARTSVPKPADSD